MKVIWIILGIIAIILLYSSTHMVFEYSRDIPTRIIIIVVYLLIIVCVIINIFISYIVSLFLYAYGQNNDELQHLSHRAAGEVNSTDSQSQPASQPADVKKPQAAAVPEPQPTHQADSSKRYCHKCGHEDDAGAIFCEDCGTRLQY